MTNNQILSGYISSLSNIVDMNELMLYSLYNETFLKDAIDNNDKPFLYSVLIDVSMDRLLSDGIVTDEMLSSIKDTIKSCVINKLLVNADDLDKALPDHAPLSEKEQRLKKEIKESKVTQNVNDTFAELQHCRKSGVADEYIPFLVSEDVLSVSCDDSADYYAALSARYRDVAHQILSIIS